MALEDILKKIENETQKEIDVLTNQSDIDLKKETETWDEKIRTGKEKLELEIQKKADNKIRQSSFKINSKVRAKIISEKTKLIESIYEETLQRMIDLSDAKKTKMLEKLIKDLPDTALTLHTDEKTEPILKNILKKEKKKLDIAPKHIPIKGGFIAKSSDFAIDNSFESLIYSIKDKLLVDLTTTLFSS